jgi:hypothetical protein
VCPCLIFVRHRHDTYDYTELCHFFKLLSLSPCQCPCRVMCSCRYLCFINDWFFTFHFPKFSFRQKFVYNKLKIVVYALTKKIKRWWMFIKHNYFYRRKSSPPSNHWNIIFKFFKWMVSISLDPSFHRRGSSLGMYMWDSVKYQKVKNFIVNL